MRRRQERRTVLMEAGVDDRVFFDYVTVPLGEFHYFDITTTMLAMRKMLTTYMSYWKIFIMLLKMDNFCRLALE